MKTQHFSHRACTFILPDGEHNHPPGRPAPRWLLERTHGCWCSSWKMTRNGLRIRRRGSWRKANPGELRRVLSKNSLKRLRLMGHG